MTEEKLLEILKADNTGSWTGDNAFKGLKIIAKYFDDETTILCAGEHDIIYSVSLSDLCKAGITEEDAIELRKLNWMEDYDSLACFV